MSSMPLSPDPYKLLGVSKDANLAEIRSAHRKLVLKCHPDKVQDAALKAIKQDEFQKVQQAYELLSDDNKRLQYDEQVKLYELRKEMGRGNPTPRSNPFEYEVKTAEPRPNSYSRSQPQPHTPKVYSHGPVPRSYEDIMYEESRHQPKKSASYDSSTDRDRRRAAEKEELRSRAERAEYIRRDEEEKMMRAREKEAKRAHSEKKKSRDKDKRRGTDDKRNRTSGPFVEDETDEDLSPRSSEKKSSRHRMEEEHNRAAEAARASTKPAPMDAKWDDHMAFAGKYMQAARRKGAAEESPSFQQPSMRRAETYAAPPTTTTREYNIRYATTPQEYSDEDSPRRSSAQRRTSETPGRRDRSRSRRSPSHHKEAPFIVEPTPPIMRKPTLHTQTSAPPNLSRELPREKPPSRSQTQDNYRSQAVPPAPSLPRAQTFTNGDYPREREHRTSGLKREVSPLDADIDRQYYPRASASPNRTPIERQTRYTIDAESHRAKPVPITSRHRADLHNLNEQYVVREPRIRDESPQRMPPLTRNTSNEARPRNTSRSTSYYVAPEAPTPIILTARPKLSRETSTRVYPSGNIQFSPEYTAEHVSFAQRPSSYDRPLRDPYYTSQGRSEMHAYG